MLRARPRPPSSRPPGPCWRRRRRCADQEPALLREGLALKWVPPREVLERVIAQIDGQIGDDPPEAIDGSPFFEPFTRLGSGIPAAQRKVLQGRARQAVVQQVVPALGRLRAFVAGDCLAAAPADGALSG